MTDTILFDYWRSSASYRVRIALNLKGVSYTSVNTSLLDGDQKAPAYVARNPQGFVPMLVIDGHDLTQSLAIIDYLDAKYTDELGQEQDAIDRWYRHWIGEGFAALETMAPDSRFFGGDRPNLADVCLVPQMANARRFATDLGPFPRLVRIDASCNELEAFQKAAPEAVKPE